MKQEQLNKYYHQIGKRLHCGKEQKKQILDGLRNDIEEFRLDHPDCSFEDIQEHFGSPEDIAGEYLNDITASDLKKELSMKVLLRKAILIIIVCILIVTACMLGLIWDAHVNQPVYYTITIE